MHDSSTTERRELRHLLSRTVFAPGQAELDQAARLGYNDSIAWLLAGDRTAPIAAPDWVDSVPPRRGRRSKEERQEIRRQGMELKGWWLRQMAATSHPLQEQMTLFWHGHFTSSLRKVKWPPLLYRQNRLLRRHALGDFRQLLLEVAKDPAMLIYLDGLSSRKGSPNENFARELLELFTLGEGHYTEQDIKEAARAFTGWSLDRRSGEFVFRRRWHDDGEKRFLGRRGRFEGQHIIEILLDHPQTARHISERIWRHFVSVAPGRERLEKLADGFRLSGYRIDQLLRGILLSPEFRNSREHGRMIKSPVELMVGAVRQLGLSPVDGEGLAVACRRLGQDLFDPPNVKGWPGGERWIDSASLMERQSLLQLLLGGRAMAKRGVGMTSRRMGMLSERVGQPDGRESLQEWLLPLPPVDPPGDKAGRQWLVALLSDPVYQLK